MSSVWTLPFIKNSKMSFKGASGDFLPKKCPFLSVSVPIRRCPSFQEYLLSKDLAIQALVERLMYQNYVSCAFVNLLKKNRLLIWCPDPSRVKKNMGYKISSSSGSHDGSPWQVTMATKNFCHQNPKIFVPLERAWKPVWKKGHILYLKIYISRD